MENFKTHCAVSGVNMHLTMHAIRNESGQMIGWVFITEEHSQQLQDGSLAVNITVSPKYEERRTIPIKGYVKSRIDNL